ncbi:hypothetical protein EMIHUDRAFT_119895 [Emiliania huxleyi CCMP1516]|uniref:Peptidase M20 dimerisation domain-containing protein n=2 Tax=Emiliania huxleyi TaxID=2903 RepID=A0A0D3IPX6_EMIH1|nr:hypothetical protein EMIHUDRAFT_119895 [Emiliania huxleyi CCMP1516]EOD13311.1 hypothetical protein EMIHUDRAFT_119895 [Emiliania huxleyi CCMP1516]|eukprot:XP_005765740.1 hypothetical protein EMIHUDRAFT_119895 [Emiliania huxleyi CCMP1516]
MKRPRPVALSDASFSAYLAHLSALVSIRTVTSDAHATAAGIEHCRKALVALLEPFGWRVSTDVEGNLRCEPRSDAIDPSRPLLWLCAHIDTVDADPVDFGGHDPFSCRETQSHLVGRGTNDCKAGVAFMLWYAEQLAAGALPAFNGGFLVTRYEEAGSHQPRSATAFARSLASGELQLAEAPHKTFFMILENTVRLRPAGAAEIGVYDRERHSVSLRCKGGLAALGSALLALEDHVEWKTVSIWPTNVSEDAALGAFGLAGSALRVLAQEGGHSCTVRNADNHVWRQLVRAAVGGGSAGDGDNGAGAALPVSTVLAWSSSLTDGGAGGSDAAPGLLWSGSEAQPTRVSSRVAVLPREAVAEAVVRSVADRAGGGRGREDRAATEGCKPPSLAAQLSAAALGGDVEHTLLLNYRGLRPLREVRAQIAQLEAALPSAVHLVGDDLEGGAGAQQACFVASSSLPRVLEAAIDGINDAAANEGTLTLKYEPNPGRSDASHLWRGLPEELRGERVVPFTCGPGHRSHRDAEGTMRKTHGPNEGFHKAAGRQVLPFFVAAVAAFALPDHKYDM